VPSDIGAWRLSELAAARIHPKPVTKIVNLVSVRGGVNGGTFETVLDMLGMSDDERRSFDDPALLVSNATRDRFHYRALKRPVKVSEEKLTEEWDGIDALMVLQNTISPQGKRKLQGFAASGGEIINI
jgi:hypothetical protein